jgi:hypothetical protein
MESNISRWDTPKVHPHNDTNLESIIRLYMPLHVNVFCWDILGFVLETNMGTGDSYDVNIDFKNDGALDIKENAYVFAYLQISEVPIGLTPKEHDLVMHRAK